ncbi:MAG TPA: cytochrome c family protein [Devosia sp.]|nr:cytochrome c family protein [Devosia sp.]
MKLIAILPLALAALATSVLAQEAALEGDPAAGKTAFAVCSSCHDVSENPRNRMGPYLTGVVGRPAASVEGFTYSQAMNEARDAGLVWTPESLKAFISGPHDYVPGTKMPNIIVRDETARTNLVAYLQSLSPDYDPETQVSTYTPPGGEAEGGASSAESSAASAPSSAQ